MKLLLTTLLSSLFIFGNVTTSNAQIFKRNKKKTEAKKPPSKPKSSFKSIKKATAKCKKHDGLFPIYQDTTNGNLYLEIDKKQLGEEFIYFSYVENGLMDVGSFKGSYRGSKIFKINQYYNNIEFELENTNYYFDPNNAISKSASTNINKPIIISEKIIGKTGDKILISASSMFLAENFAKIKPTYPPMYRGPKLGMLSKAKSKPLSIRNYPKNTDVRSLYVYDNRAPKGGSSAMTSAQSVSITYHHSILEMPKNNFKPRRDDPRVGYFMTQVNDQTSASVTPYRDMIHRWNLVKKDPDAEMSEPVEPIVWWIENTTPKELRPIIKEGVEKWNTAFEKAGFKNAVQVKIQSDTATWDAGDIRYNVLRWTSSPRPPFGGYGPSFVNPRTGQILGADIMLEYVYVLGRIKQDELFEKNGFQMEDQPSELNNTHTCSVGHQMQEDVFFGKTALGVMDLTGIEKNKFLRESIQRLVLHEVGHTLGLNHNMKGSSIQSVEDLKNQEKMDKEGMCNSVMEYPAINFALNNKDQTYYYDDKTGFYDHWAIEYGYSQALEDAGSEEKRLTRILSRSTDPKLAFGNDADDMRSPGKGIDPLVNIYDLSNDPVAYGIDRITLVDTKLMPQLLNKYAKDNQSYMELRTSYFALVRQKSIQLNIMTRQIGGVNVNRAFEGQATNLDPLTPVSYEKQKAAMDALAKYAFAPNVFEVDANLMRHLQKQRRGFGFYSSGEDPKIHDYNLSTQNGLLMHLLHPNVLKRITDTELYGNTYKLPEYLTDLTDAIFKADRKKAVSSARQNLQLLYTKYLIQYLENKRTLLSTRSQVLYQLTNILTIAKENSSDISTKAHKQHLELLIKKALKTK